MTVVVRMCARMRIYLYIYIVIQRQTVSLYQNSSVWRDPSSWDRNPGDFKSVGYLNPELSLISTKGLFFRYIFMCTLSATGVLNSLEELCFYAYSEQFF